MVHEPMQSVLSVRHECADGWHTFTSPELPGLFVTGPDQIAEELRGSLPATIVALIRASHDIEVSLQPMPSFQQGCLSAEPKKFVKEDRAAGAPIYQKFPDSTAVLDHPNKPDAACGTPLYFIMSLAVR